MHHPSWLALLPAQLHLEKKSHGSSVGCLIDHFSRQNSRAASTLSNSFFFPPKSEKLFAFERLCRFPQFPPSLVCHLFTPPAAPAFWVSRRWSAILLNCPKHNRGNSGSQLPHKSDGIFSMCKRAHKGFGCASVLAHLCWLCAKRRRFIPQCPPPCKGSAGACRPELVDACATAAGLPRVPMTGIYPWVPAVPPAVKGVCS